MNKNELKVVAKELGIKNADSLPYNKLQKAVSKAKKAKETANDPKDSDENLNSNAQETEKQDSDNNSEVPEKNLNPNDQEFEIQELDDSKSTDESIKAAQLQKDQAASDIKKVLAVPSEVLTNSSQENEVAEPVKDYYEDSHGCKYGFSSFAPEKFRFNNQVKTKQEWLQDEEAMEQLVFGNSSYVEQIFND